MSDEFLHLLLFVGVIYGLELLSFLPEPRRLLVQILRRFVPSDSGFVLRNPLPFSLAFAVEGFPLALGQEACAAYQPHRPTTGRPPGWGHRFMRYDAVSDLRVVGVELEVNGELFLKCASEPAAHALAHLLDEVRSVPAELRPALIDGQLRRMLDADRIATRRDSVLKACLTVRVASSLLFIHILATLLLFATTDWALTLWARFLAAFLLLLAFVVAQFAWAHGRLYPEARGDRWLKSFVLAANFPSACRAGETLARDAFAGFHALAVERLLCEPATFRRLAKEALLDLQFPPPWAALPPAEGARALLAEHRERALTLLSQMVRDAGVDVDELLAPPTPSAPSSFGFCPRCHTEYLESTHVCSDCQVRVTPFPRS